MAISSSKAGVRPTLMSIMSLLIFGLALYFFWPDKTLTVCGAIPAGNGDLGASCATYTCDQGIPLKGIAGAACLGGKITGITPSSR